jgi:hypothetical protein
MQSRKTFFKLFSAVAMICILSGCEITGSSPDPDVVINASPGDTLSFQVYGPIPRTEGSIYLGSPTMATYRWSADAPGSWVYENVHTDSRAYTYTIPTDVHASKIKITCQLLEITWPISGILAMRVADSRTWTIRVNLGTPPVWNGDYVIEDETDLNLLKDYTSIAEDLVIRNTGLTSLQGLEQISNAGTINIFGNSNLTSLNGMEGLTAVNGIYITRNPVLTDIMALGKITQVDDLRIESNDALENLEGLDGLSGVLGWVYIRTNAELNDITALHNVSQMRELYLWGNPALAGLEGLEGLTTITDGIYMYQTSLSSLSALRNVTTVGSFSCWDNPALVLLGMDGLARIDGTFVVSGNPLLCTSLAQALWDHVMAQGGIGNTSSSYIRDNLDCPAP